MTDPRPSDDTLKRLHILVIEDSQERRVLALEAATYSLGRDSTSAIVLQADSVSRQHALLLRVPVPASHEYQYRIVDGNAAGKASTNGIKINGTPMSQHTLADGDVVEFAADAQATYYHRTVVDPEMQDYLQAAEFRSIKLPVVEKSQTVYAESPTQRLIPENLTPDRPRLPWHWIGLGITLGLLLVGGVWWFRQRPQPSSSAPPVSPIARPL
ncbi:FHA domain-containing protein [Gloeomargarita lithophora Alchichica-D10]|uniref:FHA domain-containing protein n=1 Tax=Gloeomargarita lithophora Alchichica-D10 TaxID=1188229 RepID=A0A1J0A9D4_9CYAN|nr:FHA domain-containing protein [Gloeomargarita lithophora]APB32527.1 FHA domain-containing protein [Gloeomargarita lithophora Alchichica-D10]